VPFVTDPFYSKKGKQPKVLFPFVGNPRKNVPKGLTFELKDFIELVDLTGRCIREYKRGYIDNNLTNILTRLNISTENWLTLTTQFRKVFHGAMGNPEALTEFCQYQQFKKRATVSVCQKLFA
tara:strand:- start:176 stop:544 length:369 start_codon:yes stop_codon:yes gene_type:complete